MNEVSTTDGPRSLALSDDELIPVLRSALYPGAVDASIKLVLGYCRASGLDPMQKPVHLVPMRVKKVGGGRDDYEWRDVVMPGIGLYRTQASRTGELAGIDEPEFGPPMPMPGKPALFVPEWCRVTVYRIISGQPRPFTSREFWTENYATAGRDSDAPNAMWARRPYGQIAKCAEAQALRRAFPELGSQPTADETVLDPSEIDVTPAEHAVAPKVARKAAALESPRPPEIKIPSVVAEREPIDAEREPEPAPTPRQSARPAETKPAAKTAGFIGDGEIAYLKNKAFSVGIEIGAVLADCGGLVLDAMTKADFETVKAHLRSLEG